MRFYILLLFAVLPVFLFSNNPGELRGNVMDEVTKEPLAFANITIMQHGIQKGITNTDAEGQYKISLQPGEYDVTATYIGYDKSMVRGVKIYENQVVQLHFHLTSGVVLDEVVVIEKKFEKPLIEFDSHFSERITSSEIRKMPSRTVKSSRFDGISVSASEREPTRNHNTRHTSHPGIKAGTLTAGEVNDFSKWEMWKDIAANDLEKWQSHWRINPLFRYTVQLVNQMNLPVTDASVFLINKEKEILWEAKTDNTGKAELWQKLYGNNAEKAVNVLVRYKNKEYTFNNASSFHNGVNVYKLDVACVPIEHIDIAFVVDATGSMSDEIKYLQEELADVAQRFRDTVPDALIRMASVFYRDHNDEYLTREKDFTTNISEIVKFIQEQEARGGGDYPEAVDEALEVAINQLNWSEDAMARIIFLILDAPPHHNEPVIERLHKLIEASARKGIRIVPIAATGTNKPTEYLMRAIALATNGTYLFTTRHSGIGSQHMEPTTDKYDVEFLNNLILRVLVQFSQTAACSTALTENTEAPDTVRLSEELPITMEYTASKKAVKKAKPPTFSWKYYPNPNNGIFTIEMDNAIDEVFITDLSGKIIKRIVPKGKKSFSADISGFPNGIYLLKFMNEGKWCTGKVVVVGSGGFR